MNSIQTESVGSIPRPRELQNAITAFSQGNLSSEKLNGLFDHVVEETIKGLGAIGSPIVSDGEQTKTSFVTYPQDGLPDYTQEQFINDLVQHSVADIKSCFDNGAHHIQVDFTEARLAIKLDPSKGLLQPFINLNNQVLSHFTEQERQRIGFHTCPGGDHDSTHSADVDYADLIPLFLTLDAGNFYMQMASETNPVKSLKLIGENIRSDQRVYIGVIDIIKEEIETPEMVYDCIMTAAEYIPINQLGTTDDCGCSPFSDDIATSRETAFAKITAREEGTKMASEKLKIGS